MDKWIPRSVEHQIRDALRRMPATLLFGPRRAGKSALAQRLVAELGASGCYLDAARPADYDRLRAGASDLWPAGCKLTVIDEVHRVPQALPSLLRRNIDRPLRAGDRGGCFLHGGVGSRDQTTSNRPLSVARGFRAGCEVLRPGRRHLVHGGEETPSGHRGLVDQEMRVARHSRPLPDHDHVACAERRNCCSAVSSAVRPCEPGSIHAHSTTCGFTDRN